MQGSAKALAAAIAQLDEQVVFDSDNVQLRHDLACLYHQAGRTEEARTCYLAVLAQAPAHRGALLNLGTLLYETNFLSAARTVYEELIGLDPQHADGHVNLGNLLREQGDLIAARDHYEAALLQSRDHPQAHQGLAYVWAELGDEEKARYHRLVGFAAQPIVMLRYVGEGRPTSLLLLFSAVGGNTPLWSLLDKRRYQIHVVFVEFCGPDVVLPDHSLIVSAISDADLVSEALHLAKEVIARSTKPVVNAPERLLDTGRVAMMDRLRTIPGVLAPRTAIFTREQLMACDAGTLLCDRGFVFPLLLRTPGCHTGHHFDRVDAREDLSHVVPSLPGETLLVIAYIDCKNADDLVRKFRVMMIDGDLYPWHLAVSHDWKVHYFTSQMEQNASYRAEEARFLGDMQGVLGRRAMIALREIQARVGLDYAGIDFALQADGSIVVFEVNATMVVHPPTSVALFAYRQSAFEAIRNAVDRLLLRIDRQEEVCI